MQPPEIKIFIAGDDLISPDVQTERNALVLSAAEIKAVTTSSQNNRAGQTVVAMRKHVKATTADRMTITRRFDDAKKIVMDFFEAHNLPLEGEIIRLQRLGTAFVESENRRVAIEEKKRGDEFEAKLKAEMEALAAAEKAATPVQEMIANRKLEIAQAATMKIINAPEPEVEKAKGQSFKQVLKWEIDESTGGILALVKARPDLCKIEAKASAINAVCHPNLPVPGLKLWFENVSTYTTR
jgi:hypothetical protein